MNKDKRIGRKLLCLVVSLVMVCTLIPRSPASVSISSICLSYPNSQLSMFNVKRLKKAGMPLKLTSPFMLSLRLIKQA